jgi:hypothetical protein
MATHFYLVSPQGADFFKFGITKEPKRRIMAHLNTVGAATVHIAPLDDPEGFETLIKAQTDANGTRRGQSETACMSARDMVIQHLRGMRVPILEFQVIIGELPVPDCIPGLQSAFVGADDQEYDEPEFDEHGRFVC